MRPVVDFSVSVCPSRRMIVSSFVKGKEVLDANISDLFFYSIFSETPVYHDTDMADERRNKKGGNMSVIEMLLCIC